MAGGRDFNPHHHAGGDSQQIHTALGWHNFNPHHHAGGDSVAHELSFFHVISIHTTTQVVTLRVINKINVINNFNPHHHAGGDCLE